MIVVNLNNLINSDNMVTMYSLRYEPLTHSRVLKYNTDVTYIKKRVFNWVQKSWNICLSSQVVV